MLSSTLEKYTKPVISLIVAEDSAKHEKRVSLKWTKYYQAQVSPRSGNHGQCRRQVPLGSIDDASCIWKQTSLGEVCLGSLCLISIDVFTCSPAIIVAMTRSLDILPRAHPMPTSPALAQCAWRKLEPKGCFIPSLRNTLFILHYREDPNPDAPSTQSMSRV